MQLSASALKTIIADFNAKNYAAMYAAAYNDLKTHYPNATGADADVIHWLQIAQQVNSGAKTSAAIGIRAVNAVAEYYETGKFISLFGSEEQASSNEVAKGFYAGINKTTGAVQNFKQIIQNDASQGLHSLGLSPAAWAGALPDSLANSFTGFTTDNYYDSLTATQKLEANKIHVVAFAVKLDQILGEKLGLSQSLTDKIIDADMQIDLEIPTPVTNLAVQIANNVVTKINMYEALDTIFNSLAANLTSSTFLNTAETDIENLFGLNKGVNISKNIFEVGADINLNLSTPAAPRFNLDLSSANGTLTLANATPLSQSPIAQDVTFVDNAGLLQLNNPQNYNGIIYNFLPGDMIDLTNIGTLIAITLGAKNVLTLTESNGSKITLSLDPAQSFSSKTFGFKTDGKGGTDVFVNNETYSYKIIATPGKVPSSTISFNDLDEVIGYYSMSNQYTSFIYANNKFASFPASVATGNEYYVSAMNDSHEVVGYYFTGSVDHGYMYKYGSNTAPKSFDVSGSEDTAIFGVNNIGDFVGNYQPSGANNVYGFASENNVVHTLSIGGAAIVDAMAINDSKEIAGYYINYDNSVHGFVESAAGATPITVNAPGASNTTINSINDAGEFIATAYDKGDNAIGSYLYDYTNGAVNLIEEIPLSVGIATSINNLGQIAGATSTGALFIGTPTISATSASINSQVSLLIQAMASYGVSSSAASLVNAIGSNAAAAEHSFQPATLLSPTYLSAHA